LVKALSKYRPLYNGKNLVIELVVELLVVGARISGPFELFSSVKTYVFKDIEYVDLLLGVGEDLVESSFYLLIVVC
jgi:hypothetical protein